MRLLSVTTMLEPSHARPIGFLKAASKVWYMLRYLPLFWGLLAVGIICLLVPSPSAKLPTLLPPVPVGAAVGASVGAAVGASVGLAVGERLEQSTVLQAAMYCEVCR
jgi:hypothetical protein